MKDKFGIILLDKQEVIIYIYEKTDDNKLIKIFDKQYDLNTFSEKNEIHPAEVVEIIAQTAMDRAAATVVEWKICTRGMEDTTAAQIAHITSIKAEVLTLTREQELICKAIATEFL